MFERALTTPTPAACLGAFDDIARAKLLTTTQQVLYSVYNAHKMRPGFGLLVVLSYLADLRDCGHPLHLWRGLIEAERQIDRALDCVPICLVSLTGIRFDAIESCRRKP